MSLTINPKFDISFNKHTIIKSNTLKPNYIKCIYNYFKFDIREKESCKMYMYICGSSWIIFIIFEFSVKYLCHHIDEYEDLNYTLYHNMNLITFGTFIMLWFSLLYKLVCIYKENHTNTFIAIFILFNVMTQTLIAEILIVSDNSPVCIDYFGVVSESSIWGEWLSATPIIIYYTLSISNTMGISKTDFAFIFSLFLSIFFGFLIHIKNKYTAIIFLCLAYLTSIPGIILPFYVYFYYYRNKILPDNKYSFNNKKTNELIHVSFKLSLYVMTYITVYGIIYLLALFGVFDETSTLVVFQIINIVTKNFYYEICLEDTITIIDKLETKIIDESTELNARKNYFQGIMQEIYNPLNVLVIGTNLISEYFDMNNKDEKDIIFSIQNAINNISSTINDFKMIQLIENETLKLNYEQCYIIYFINELKIKVENIFDNIHIKFIINDNNLNDVNFIYLDSKYIKHVIISIIYYIIQNLVLNDNNIFIEIQFNKGYIDNDSDASEDNKFFRFFNRTDSNNVLGNPLLSYLNFSIIYNGKKLLKKDYNKIFERFNYNKYSEKDIILDLYLCKKIITMHGGYISINSNNSTSFTIGIPLTQDEPIGYANRLNQIRNIRNSFLNTSSKSNTNDNSYNHHHDNWILDLSGCNIKGHILIINSFDKLIEKFIEKQNYYCDSIDDIDLNNDVLLTDFSKYIAIIIYHFSKTHNVLDICKKLREKEYLNNIVVVTFDLEINYNNYIDAGANLVLFHPIRLNELQLLFS